MAKTAVFALLRGVLAPTSGHLHHSHQLRFGYLPQNLIIAGQLSSVDYLWNSLPEFAKAHRAMQQLEAISKKEILASISRFYELDGYQFETHLGNTIAHFALAPEQLKHQVCSLSGGEKTKLALCRLILQESDLFLLDEPTNHLDVPTLAWLEAFLQQQRLPYVIISHDRYFIDRIAIRSITIERQ